MPMNDNFDKALDAVLVKCSANTSKADDTLKYSQAALNLAQAKQILDSIDKPPAKTKAA